MNQLFAHATRLAPYSIVSTPEHDVHRQRRNGLNSFFSIASIRRLDPILQDHIGRMLRRLEKVADSGEPLQIHRIFKACASDVITTYAMADSFNYLEMEDYGKTWFVSTDAFFYLTHVFFVFPWLVKLVQTVPSWLLEALFPSLKYLRLRQEVCII